MLLHQILTLIFAYLVSSQSFTLSSSRTNQIITISSSNSTDFPRPYLQLSPAYVCPTVFSFDSSSRNITVASSAFPSSLTKKNLYLQKPTKYDPILTPYVGDIDFWLYAFWNTWEITKDGYLRIGIWGRRAEDKRWFACSGGDDKGLEGRVWHLDFLGSKPLPCNGSNFDLRVNFGSGRG
ncbi:Protein of unknown function [Pyronema omphalodes CBS 100304]|uniref:Uncharacterized protein n=1 Tax=Pyronema omphalodes (strain CBS 100304) TaxID=1076935 RepID=U4LWT0_PYROM|nr:Protein of unknown function [Pyronema omphalodes CBS 100304]